MITDLPPQFPVVIVGVRCDDWERTDTGLWRSELHPMLHIESEDISITIIAPILVSPQTISLGDRRWTLYQTIENQCRFENKRKDSDAVLSEGGR